VIAVATPEGRVETRSGECEGLIALSACGTRHFGYDPVFLIPQLDKTMAELPDDIKNSISHRAKAASKARALLATYYK
jgi:XTP/dITP diphosphohydrolase